MQTRVPEKWRDEANELDVALTEYIRMMVRAGRLDWGFEHTEEPDCPHVKVDEESSGADEQIETIVKDTIVRNLSCDSGTAESELTDIILHDVEAQVGQILNDLADEDIVRYDAVQGGWVKQR